jgi:hypothetical protein
MKNSSVVDKRTISEPWLANLRTVQLTNMMVTMTVQPIIEMERLSGKIISTSSSHYFVY